MFTRKRKFGRIFSLSMIIFFIFSCFAVFGCQIKINPLTVIDGEFSVHFLDVDEGDAILINFPDGKNMLIDSGDVDETISEYVISCISKTDEDFIDYVIITHPDSDHIGNMLDIAERFSIGTAFVPDIKNPERFQLFNRILTTMKNKGTKIVASEYGVSISGEGYFVAFLSPAPSGNLSSIYDDVNSTTFPSSDVINDLSPIMYLQCFGKRFVFTGDAGSSQEKLVMDNYTTGIYNVCFGKGIVVLENVDVLKVSHHGSNSASTEEFVKLLKPKHAVVSVGKNNYGHPSSAVLARLVEANPEVVLLRTDVKGTISMRICDNCSLKIDEK